MKYVINLPINFFASVRFIAKFTSCNDLKYHKSRYKSSGNNVIEIFQLCAGSLWRIFKFSGIYNTGIMPVTDVMYGVVTLNPGAQKVNIARYAGF